MSKRRTVNSQDHRTSVSRRYYRRGDKRRLYWMDVHKNPNGRSKPTSHVVPQCFDSVAENRPTSLSFNFILASTCAITTKNSIDTSAITKEIIACVEQQKNTSQLRLSFLDASLIASSHPVTTSNTRRRIIHDCALLPIAIASHNNAIHTTADATEDY